MLQRSVGHQFADLQLLDRALAHRSWVAETDDVLSNERLEFLGDAVLGWIVADIVFHRFGDEAEGALTNLRKSVVNGRALADVARQLGLGPHIRLGRGEANAGGHDKESILADALEAVIGAVYLDGGHDAAVAFVAGAFNDRITEALEKLDRLDEKSALQELASRLGLDPPAYSFTARGPDHDKTFTVTVVVGDVAGSGRASTKKRAEQAAAAEAVNQLQVRESLR